LKPGDVAHLTVARKNQSLELQTTVGKRPPQQQAPEPAEPDQ
jgi:hypothetical protein